MKTTKTLLSVAIIAATLGACTNTKVANNKSLALAAQQEAQQTQISPEQAIKQASKTINKGVDQGLRFYAPLHLEKAEKQLEKARDFASKEASAENNAATIAAALTADKLVQAAFDNKTVVEKELATQMQHIDILRELGTDKAMPKDFNKATASLNDLIREIEGQNMSKMAKDRSKLSEYMNSLEATTLKQQYLSKALLMLDKATDADADDLAQQSYQQARSAIKRADNYIDKNFRDRDGVKKVSDEAYQAASKAYYVALEVERIYQADRKKLEQFVLNIHKHLEKVNSSVGVENLGSYSLREQASLIHEALDKNVQKPVSKAPASVKPAVEEPAAEQTTVSDAVEEDAEVTDSNEAKEANLRTEGAEGKAPEFEVAE